VTYTTPPTFVADEILAAADLNILGDDIVYLKGISDGVAFSGCQITRVAATSIATSTDSPITWSSETFDYGGWWSSGTNVVVPAGAIPAGYTSIAVLVIARTRFASNGTGNRKISVKKNGSSFGNPHTSALSGDATPMDVTELEVVEAGDIITFEVWQSSGGALDVSQTQLTVVRFAPAA
jgi:hypothetical protein